MACFQQLLVDAAIPLGKLELSAQVLLGLLFLQSPLLFHVRPHHRVEVAVGFGAAGDGGGRRAIELVRYIFYRLFNGFCALDVSLTLLPR